MEIQRKIIVNRFTVISISTAALYMLYAHYYSDKDAIPLLNSNRYGVRTFLITVCNHRSNYAAPPAPPPALPDLLQVNQNGAGANNECHKLPHATCHRPVGQAVGQSRYRKLNRKQM